MKSCTQSIKEFHEKEFPDEEFPSWLERWIEEEKLEQKIKKMHECIGQNRVQWTVMVLGFQKHGQNINVQFFIDHCQKQIEKCTEGLSV